LGEKRPDVREGLAGHAQTEMAAAVQATRCVLEDLLELPTPTMDFSRTVRCARKTTFDRSFYLEIRENELKRLREEMEKPIPEESIV
jgi:hypothetical protein